jgi:hypothetical protein
MRVWHFFGSTPSAFNLPGSSRTALTVAVRTWPETTADDDLPRVNERAGAGDFTHNDSLPELSVHGCTVFYAGRPIYEAASPEAAIVYRDRLINLYT